MTKCHSSVTPCHSYKAYLAYIFPVIRTIPSSSLKRRHEYNHTFEGLDDSRNTARLAWRLICDGCVLKITKSLDKVSHYFVSPCLLAL